MITYQMLAAAAPGVARNARHWIFHLGAVGFIPLGVLDSSIIPLPGSMDVLTIVLAARNGDFWIYYALMATLGSVIGGFLTYRLARKGGKEALTRRFPRRKLGKVYRMFERWGFGTIAIPAVLPPPAPMVPFLLAAGAMQYPLGKFLAALTLGRVIRYSVLAYLGARYGRYMLTFLARFQHPILIACIVLLASAGTAVLVVILKNRKKKSASA
jgi:membrane protein YqaA with SNARE-associated domain